MDICSNALQSLFNQLTRPNSKIGCDAEAMVLGSAQQIPVPSLRTSPGSSRMAETVRGFLIKVNCSPVRLKLIDPVLDDWFMKFSIHFEKCMELLWNLLDRATLIIIFHTEDTVMEFPILYSFLSSPFSWHVSKFKLHWYRIVIMMTKNVRGASFFWNTLYSFLRCVFPY